MVIWKSYVAREHPDTEYKYRCVFLPIIDHQGQRRDLNNIYTLNTFITHLTLYYYLVPLDLFSKLPKRTGLVYSLVFGILLPPSQLPR